MDFAPDGRRARELDVRMHREASASIQHVLETCGDWLGFGPDLFCPVLSQLNERLSFPPPFFAAYYQLVRCILAEDRGGAREVCKSLSSVRPATGNMIISPLTNDAFGRLCADLLRDGPDEQPLISPPAALAASAFSHTLGSAIDLIERELPPLAAEMAGLVRMLVIVARNPQSDFRFDGGSHYQLWGALFVNHDCGSDLVSVAEVLAHESAHSLLFGLCVDMPLVNNPPEQLARSPLRPDPRPIDGIFHASFVSARMHWALSRLAKASSLTADQRKTAADRASQSLRNFCDGRKVLREQADFTALGEEIIQSADDYVAEFIPTL